MSIFASAAEAITSLEKDFGRFSDWEERYKYIIALGKDLPPFPEEHRSDDLKVKGCQSQVWLHGALENKTVVFQADSDALIVKGLIAVLLRVYSGRSPTEILQTPADFLQQLGITSHLSQNRTNGLAAMVKQIKIYALAFGQLVGQ